MIRYQEMVPDFYIEKSRDFQVLCRLYDFVLNGLKYNIDSMESLTDTRRVKDTVLPLLGDKLGIYDRDAYSNRQMLEALPIAIKYKGSLKSINILLNAFLDSMDIFNSALVLHSKDEESAAEISEILNREIKPFSLVIILSTFPNLTNLHILDTYLKMVLPTGMLVEYGFGIQKAYLDKFKYKEYTLLYYTSTREYDDEPMTVPMIGMIKNKDEKYSSAFVYTGTDNVRTRREFVGDLKGVYSHTLKHTAAPKPPATEVEVFKVCIDNKTGSQISRTELVYNPEGVYTITLEEDCICYIEYSYNKTEEFVKNLNENGFDVNAVSIGTIISRDQVEK